jgi:hypothetical protein
VETVVRAIEFAAYLAPGTAPLSDQEVELIKQQTADLIGCPQALLKPRFFALGDTDDIEAEFSWIPEHEQSRDPLLCLISLLRSGVHPVGDTCCMLVYDTHAPFSVIDYLKALAEITRLPVLLGVCDRPAAGAEPRRILVRRLR